MKKLMALLLSLVMLLSLAACGGKENPVNDDDDEKESTVQTDDKNGDKDDDTVNEVPKGKKKIEKYGLYLYIDEKYEVDDTYDNETNCIYEEVREITLVSGLVSETTNQYATGKEMAQGHYDREKDGYQTVELGERNGVSYVLTRDDDGFYYVTSSYVVGERWWMIHVWYLDAVGYEDEIIEIATSAHAPEAEDSTVKPNDKEDDDGLPAGKQKVEIDGLYVFVDEAYEIRDNYDYEKTMSCYMGDREDVQLSTDLVSNGRYQFSTSAEMAQVYFDAATEEKLGERNGISYVVDTDEEWVCVTGYYVVGDQWWTINVYSVSGDQYREEMIDFVTTAHVPQTDDVDQGNSGNDAAEPSGALYEELMNHPESPESDFWVNDNGDGTGVLFRYNGSDEIVVIPETINGLRIIEMADFAFWNNETLKAVCLADSIETAGMYAFQNNTNLEVAVYGSGMRETGSGTFHNCESLYQVVLNDGIEVIEGSCFYGCTALETIHIPDSVKEVVYLAFSGCTSLKEIKLPEGIEYVSGSLFVDCTSLKSVYIPDSVTSISQSAFMGCTSLESIEIPAAVTTIFENAFTGCTSLKEIRLPEGMQGITEGCFQSCESLQRVVIPDTVFRIDDGAFQNCKSLTSIEVPVSVIYIADDAFDSCPEGFTIIGEAGSDAEYFAKENNINFLTKD